MIDGRTEPFDATPERVAALCRRRTGIGADGLMILESDPAEEFRMRYFNADGGEATMCGNGGRCIALFAHHLGIGGMRKRFIGVDGPHTAELLRVEGPEGEIRLGMIDVRRVEVHPEYLFLDTGSPHYVEFVESVRGVDVAGRGAAIRHSAAFAARGGTNVNFVEIVSDGHIRIRTFERGVEAETLACGTGATASAIAAAVRTGSPCRDYRVDVEGGTLRVAFEPDGKGGFTRIELTGPANGLRDGWFRVKELAPPTGFSIKDSDTQEAFIPAGKGHTFLFENTPLSALVVYKQDSVTGAGISGCRFQLKYLGGEVSGSGGTVIGNYVSSANGSFTATGLKKGYYICEELESDGAHVIDSAPQSFYISGEDQDIVTLYFSNAPKGAVLVKKVSDDDKKLPLSGVEFFVTTSDGAVVGDNNGKFVTDSAGSFLVENVAPGTSLVVKETRAKPGYLLDDVPQTVQVKAGQTVTLEFRNKPLGNLVIEKWGRNGTKTVPLEGVKFEIKYADGRYVDDGGGTLSSKGIYYSDSTGKITLSGVTGTVIATELESVSGYTIDPDSQSQTVTINPNDTQTLRFYNNAVGGVEIIKVSSADKTKRIPNTTFEIRRVSDDALVDTVTTGKTGSVFVTLEDDSYYAVETESAEGFKLDNTPHYFTVKDGSCPPLTVTNAPLSGILLHKISTADGKGIPGVSFILYDSGHNPIDQQTTDDRGYAWFEDLTVSGRYYLRELENEGYIPDTQERTVYVKAGETTKVTWKNTPITGQIQIVKKSADYNPTTGLPAGTLLEGAVFEITDKAGNVVDTIRSDSRGLAVSKPLPLSRYTIREVKAPSNYGVNEQELTAYLEHEGQIVRFEVTNKSLTTGVSIAKTGPKEAMSGQPVRYTFSGISNTSNVRLDSFYFRDSLPAQVRLSTVVTGTWNFPGTYKITYRVNGGEHRTLADNLSTSKSYTLDASAAALGLAGNERVTEIMFVFGQAPAGFAQVEKPYLNCTAVSNLNAGSSFVNIADVGGVYNGTWVQAISRWVTKVYGKPIPLPRTGY